MTSKTISDQISKFLLKLQSSKDASEHTIRAYEADLRHWARFIECSKKVSSIKELEKQIHPSWFRDYFSQGLGWSRATAARKCACLRSFFRCLADQGSLSRDLTGYLPRIKVPQKLPRFLTIEQALKLIELPKKHSFLGSRDRALFDLLYGAGLRIFEVTEIQLQHLDFQSRWITVLG